MSNGIEVMRPARTTQHLGLPVPGDAGAADQVTVTGELADALDALYARLLSQPGDIKASAAAVPGAGWLLCDGQAIARNQFPDLFAAIGTAFGPGDGVSTFNLPDLRDRFPRGSPMPANVGQKGGEVAVKLTTAEMPYHAHGGSTTNNNYDHSHWIGGGTGWNDRDHSHHSPISGNVPVTQQGGQGAAVVGGAGHDTSGANTPHAHSMGFSSGTMSAYHQHGVYAEGGGAAHNNLPPFQMVNYFIKT